MGGDKEASISTHKPFRPPSIPFIRGEGVEKPPFPPPLFLCEGVTCAYMYICDFSIEADLGWGGSAILEGVGTSPSCRRSGGMRVRPSEIPARDYPGVDPACRCWPGQG
ncbi:hypothetical protein TNIN_336941 [Trichonephila inaurata madagascariensis]|uniref:Uncharacterized protein n=1 Tax=Trichonephila inaurata madagascariensis TaxID=2747483 RepID=A0A8X6WLA6_9ARAC|nr:hypothetical protein TNIN_336941 [Trichonephila inaurata madagascariensis]